MTRTGWRSDQRDEVCNPVPNVSAIAELGGYAKPKLNVLDRAICPVQPQFRAE